MFLLGTADVFVNWLNLLNLTHEDRQRGLIVGPIPDFLWIMLLVFTLISTVLYFPEAANTFSALFNGGQSKVRFDLDTLYLN